MHKQELPPLVSVLMPVNKMHNYLDAAIESIQKQNYTNYEVLLVDNSDEGLKLPQLPNNFFIHRISGNSGLSKALNFGIKHAKGKYILRMDSDDIAATNRLTRQIEFLEKNTEVDILGCGIEIIGSELNRKVSIGEFLERTSANGNVIEFLLYKNPLFHPTVAFRSDSLRKTSKLYDSRYDGVEDLELWMRLSRTLRIENMPDVLLKYRIHDEQSGSSVPRKSEFYSNLIKMRHSTWVLFHVTGLRTKASKALLRSLVTFLRLMPSYCLFTMKNNYLKKYK